ncbi:MAG TPA: Crp/Fnr family transcriptional regulator [Gemmatimonadales bacterium]|jgi:CRP-like cAMP-binding protein|nr:Crp/Fnr family transcriptional regulator [Gemmatimonadales bacterium]
MLDQRVLAKVASFAALPSEARNVLANRGVLLSLGKGQYLFHAGDAPRGLILVLEGRVRVINERDGRRHLVHEDSAGATLGEVPLVLGGGYPASAVAATALRCALFSREALHAAIAASPEVAWFLMRGLTARIRTLVARLGQVSGTPVRQALAAMILERAVGTAPLALGATQQELAESLGTVREVVARHLTALKRAGAIRSAGRGLIAVADRKQLIRLARAEPM